MSLDFRFFGAAFAAAAFGLAAARFGFLCDDSGLGCVHGGVGNSSSLCSAPRLDLRLAVCWYSFSESAMA
jgi:hypothetical protein